MRLVAGLDVGTTGCKVTVFTAGTVGCAMLAGVAAGVFADLESAAKAMVRKTGTFAPDPARHADYSRIYERYDKLYMAVRPLV